jgi:hypothetical protein
LRGIKETRTAYRNLFGATNRQTGSGGEQGVSIHEHWGWQLNIYEITNGDKTKEDAYWNMTLIEWYNRLALMKDVQDDHKERMEAIKQKMQVR